MYHYLFLASIVLLSSLSSVTSTSSLEDGAYWKSQARKALMDSLGVRNNERRARNVILFVGDGMGPNTLSAARIYQGGESSHFVFDDFPHIGLLKTYAVDRQVPDSASTATALFCGVKSNFETVGVDATVKLKDCAASLRQSGRVSSILSWAQKAGKATGFITNTRVTHATPSALYAHSADRRWECDTSIPTNARACKDIARQLVEDLPGRDINVIFGGGRQSFVPKAEATPLDPLDSYGCQRSDGKDLIATWQANHKAAGRKAMVLKTTADLSQIPPDVGHVLGLFANGHLPQDRLRDNSTGEHNASTPSLENLVTTAIRVLQQHPEGFVLVVEGGLIDLAHHRGHARQALDEVLAMERAVRASQSLTSSQDTLTIVTSDHAHSLTFVGYPLRGNSVLGISQPSKVDGINMTALGYATGGANNFQFHVSNDQVKRIDPSTRNTTSFDYSHHSGVLSDESVHGGADVAVFADGPWAHLFHSVHEQNYVAYVIAYASGIGDYRYHSSANSVLQGTYYTCLLTIIVSQLLSWMSSIK